MQNRLLRKPNIQPVKIMDFRLASRLPTKTIREIKPFTGRDLLEARRTYELMQREYEAIFCRPINGINPKVTRIHDEIQVDYGPVELALLKKELAKYADQLSRRNAASHSGVAV